MDSPVLLASLRTCKVLHNSEVLNKLTDFNQRNQNWFGVPAPHGVDHSELVDVLFSLIVETSKSRVGSSESYDMEEVMSMEMLRELFRCLKILSRAKEYALAISSFNSHFSTLLSYGNIIGDGQPENYQGFHIAMMDPDHQMSLLMQETQIEILKVICNSVFHSKDSRCVYKKNCCSKYVTGRLWKLAIAEHYDIRITSVLVKILFIMSALDTEERDRMRFILNTGHVLLKLLEKGLTEIRNSISKSGDDSPQKIYDVHCEEIKEILKTLFNISVKISDDSMLEDSECKTYCLLVEILHNFLTEPSLKDILYKGFITDVANLLINLPRSCLSNLIPGVERRKWEDPVPTKFGYALEYELKSMSAVITLLQFLDEGLEIGCGIQADASQAFSILVSLCHICRSLRVVRKYLRKQILPPLKEVPVRPEEEQTLKGRIIKLMTHPEINIKTIAADFLFVLCKEDPDRLVKYTGYGNAAGLFAARGLLGGGKSKTSIEYSSDDDDSETEEYTAIVDKVDPITGGIASKPDRSLCENMTDKEKEASANELMRLIDQMSSLDIIKPATIGDDGRPLEVDTIKAKELIQEKLEKDREDSK